QSSKFALAINAQPHARPHRAAVTTRHRRRGDRVIKRREFITLLSGAAAWPLAARTQQSERARRIGVLMSTGVDDPQDPARLAAFAQGLQELGWTIGRNLRIDYRWGASSPDNTHSGIGRARAGRDAGERHHSIGGCTEAQMNDSSHASTPPAGR